jgi:hypothetical protein
MAASETASTHLMEAWYLTTNGQVRALIEEAIELLKNGGQGKVQLWFPNGNRPADYPLKELGLASYDHYDSFQDIPEDLTRPTVFFVHHSTRVTLNLKQEALEMLNKNKNVFVVFMRLGKDLGDVSSALDDIRADLGFEKPLPYAQVYYQEGRVLPMGYGLDTLKAWLAKMAPKGAVRSSAAAVRQALIEARGDPHAAAKIVMAGPKRDKNEKKSKKGKKDKKEKLGGVGKKDDSFEMPVSKYGLVTEPVWYINKMPRVAKQATRTTKSTITVPGARAPMPVQSVVNIAMVDSKGRGRTWGFFYDESNERVIISFARPKYDTDANVAGLVEFIESRLRKVSKTTDLYYKYFRERGVSIPLDTAAPSSSSSSGPTLPGVYGASADDREWEREWGRERARDNDREFRTFTRDPFDETNFVGLEPLYSSDEE